MYRGGVGATARRLTIFVVALFVLACVSAAVAVADHRHKNARIGPANVASWYCQHRGQRCAEQRREQVYRVSFWPVSLGGMTALVPRLRRRI